MKSSISINWMGNMAFEGDFEGHKIIFDADTSVGGEGKGLRPKPMMLYALAGCTAMDVVAILKKMRVEIENLEVSVEAEMTEEHPKHYISMHVIYAFRGKDLPMDKLEKAINLSEERYCGVGFVYRKVMPVTHEIRIME
jgi:putative redox protein